MWHQNRIDYRKIRGSAIALIMTMGMAAGFTACGDTQENAAATTERVTERETESVTESETEHVSERVTEQRTDMEDTETVHKEMSQQSVTEQFYAEPLSEEVKGRITGISYPVESQSNIAYEDLRYVHVLHYDFNGETAEGELICNQAIADDLVEIFQDLYEAKYPIERIRLIDEYDGDDEASMEDNNTSCFNYRTIAGSDRLSIHSYGCAIDINPLYNPYVSNKSNGTTVMQPVTAEAYIDRSLTFEHKITTEDLCYELFTEHGFIWGGSWNNPKDYQHFEKSMENR